MLNTNCYERVNSSIGTPLDDCYDRNESPLQQEMIALLRSKGGKANRFDENGEYVNVGEGNVVI